MTPFSKWTAAASAVFAFTAGITHSAGAEEVLRLTGYGGSWAKQVQTIWIEPFTKDTGIKVIYDTWDLKLGKIRAMVEAKNITSDLFVGNAQDAIAGCDDGILEKIDHKIVGDPKDYPPGALMPCGVSSNTAVVLFVWNRDKIPNGPKTLAEVFDIKKFPGKRSLTARGYGLPELVLLADGVPKDKVYDVLGAPGGYERVFKYLAPMKKDIIWWSAQSTLALQLLVDGEVNYSLMPGFRYYDAMKDGKNFQAMWNGAYFLYDTWMIPTAAPNRANALKFLAYIFPAERQAAMTNLTTIAPTHRDAVKHVKPEFAQYLPMGKNLDNGIFLNFPFWAERLDGFLKQFEAWKQQ